MGSRVTIYALCDRDGMIRYIGQTRCRLSVRLKFHIKKQCGAVGRWIASEIKAGRKPTADQMVPLQTAATWDVDEIIWIERGRLSGWPLLNQSKGGKDGYRKPKQRKHLNQRKYA